MFNLFNENCLETIKNKRFDFKKTVVVTDPPFNVGYHYNEYKDNMEENEYFDFLNDVTKKFPSVMKKSLKKLKIVLNMSWKL